MLSCSTMSAVSHVYLTSVRSQQLSLLFGSNLALPVKILPCVYTQSHTQSAVRGRQRWEGSLLPSLGVGRSRYIPTTSLYPHHYGIQWYYSLSLMLTAFVHFSWDNCKKGYNLSLNTISRNFYHSVCLTICTLENKTKILKIWFLSSFIGVCSLKSASEIGLYVVGDKFWALWWWGFLFSSL